MRLQLVALILIVVAGPARFAEAGAPPSATPTPGADVGILVPAYFYPTPGGNWEQLERAAARVSIAAIFAPHIGPGPSYDPKYGAAIDRLRAAGGKVLGYVHTSWATRPSALVRADIDAYHSWYRIDGIFFDEMTTGYESNHPENSLEYYRGLRKYLHLLERDWIVVGNPGRKTKEVYLQAPVADTIVQFENETGFEHYLPPSYQSSYDAKRCANIMHGVSSATTMVSYVERARSQNCGWIYVTDDRRPNPYDELPKYWLELIAAIENRDGHALPVTQYPPRSH